MQSFSLKDRVFGLEKPWVMAILNSTPDSFSDGGEYMNLDAARIRGKELQNQGADILDLGGASSHPLAKPVTWEEEASRVLPLVEALLKELMIPLSIDTKSPEVAERCLKLGAHMINDVSGLADPRMAKLAAAYKVPLVLMCAHSSQNSDTDILEHLQTCWKAMLARAKAEGATSFLLDPGFGFAKTLLENCDILRKLYMLQVDYPILICTSRKGSLARLCGQADPKERIGATMATSIMAVQNGAKMVRVHDAFLMRQAIDCLWRVEAYQGV